MDPLLPLCVPPLHSSLYFLPLPLCLVNINSVSTRAVYLHFPVVVCFFLLPLPTVPLLLFHPATLPVYICFTLISSFVYLVLHLRPHVCQRSYVHVTFSRPIITPNLRQLEISGGRKFTLGATSERLGDSQVTAQVQFPHVRRYISSFPSERVKPLFHDWRLGLRKRSSGSAGWPSERATSCSMLSYLNICTTRCVQLAVARCVKI
jgi:hypothetical protein